MSDLMELVNECAPIAAIPYDPRVESALARAEELKSIGLVAVADEIRKKALEKKRLAMIANGKYPVITPEKIQAFLNRRAEEYNKAHPKKKRDSNLDTLDLINNYYLHPGALSRRAGMSAAREMYESMNQLRNMQIDNMRAQQMAIQSAYSQALAFGQSGVFVGIDASMPAEAFSAATNDVSSTAEGTVGRYMWSEVRVETYKTLPPPHAVVKLKEEKAKNVFDYFTIASVNAVRDPLLLGRLDGKSERYFLAQWGDDVSLDDVI